MNSLWNNTASLPPHPMLERDLQTNVLIIGGGICGLLCAYMLSQEGVDCALVEAGRICSRTSGNTTAKITFQHGLIYHKLIEMFGLEKAAMYLDANRSALERYRALCRDANCDFETKAAVVYATDTPKALEQEYSAYQALGIQAEFCPTLPFPFSTAGGLRITEQAQLHPLKLAAFLAARLNIYENTPVLSYDGQRVITPTGSITASHIIVTTHFPIFNKHGAYFLKMYQHRSYVTALKNAPLLPDMYVDGSQKGFSFRTYQDRLLLGGGAHRTGGKGGGWQELTEFAKQNYPGAAEETNWAAQDCMTLDNVPYIGEYSARTPNLYVATGFQKWGFTSSMAAATILCDMIHGRSNDTAAVFSPSRTILRPQLAKNIAASAIHLLTPTTPRCPHMGCALKWNPQERSWDCPCHGSRFAEKGHVSETPATSDLPSPDKKRKK